VCVYVLLVFIQRVNNYCHLLLAAVNHQTLSCLLFRFPAEFAPFCDHRANAYQRENNLPYVTVKTLQHTIIFPEFSLPFIPTYFALSKKSMCTAHVLSLFSVNFVSYKVCSCHPRKARLVQCRASISVTVLEITCTD
jgi:hypothetical protein